jgi:hypothetical protein
MGARGGSRGVLQVRMGGLPNAMQTDSRSGIALARLRLSSLRIIPVEPRNFIAAIILGVFALRAGLDRLADRQNWAASEKAVDALIDLQTKFVAWWNRAVSPNEMLGPKSNPVTRRGQDVLSADEAHAYTGIHKNQVSRWRAPCRSRRL